MRRATVSRLRQYRQVGTVFLADRVEMDLVDFGMTWSNVLDEDATAIVEEAQRGDAKAGSVIRDERPRGDTRSR